MKNLHYNSWERFMGRKKNSKRKEKILLNFCKGCNFNLYFFRKYYNMHEEEKIKYYERY